jgi:hypothetical protein
MMAWEHLVLGDLEPGAVSDFDHPDAIAGAPAAFMVPLVQSIRQQSLVQVRRVTGNASTVRLPGALPYSRRRLMSDVYEGIQVTLLGRRCRLPGSSQYPSVVERNASHFAPLSWHRWRAFHRTAREMITRVRGPLPAGFLRRRPPAQQDAGHAVVRRMADHPAAARRRPGLARGHDTAPPAAAAPARPV